jgi:hypothetical protein
MSPNLKPVPQRLKITARYQHETVSYGGNIFEFIEQLMADRKTGVGTFRLNQGREYGLEFDFREKIVDIEGG